MIKKAQTTFIALFTLWTGFHQTIALAEASQLNTATIAASTLKAFPKCVHYRLRGVCNWVNNGIPNTTPYIEQYSPDVVVIVFNKPGDNPWFEVNNTLDQASQVVQKQEVTSLTHLDVGDGQHSLSDQHEQNVFFKEADIIGNPALAVLPDEFVLLPSTANPLQPYYQSMVDSAAWRGLLPTSLAEEAYAMGAYVPHHIGTGLITWGGVYPHEGKVATSNDAKAAAVIAQRAGDLITSSELSHLTGHIFYKLSNQCGQECQAAPVQENSDKTRFQMIYPVEDDDCDDFENDTVFGKTSAYGDDLEKKSSGAYVWVIWRFYSGCADGDGTFINKVIWN